MRESGERSADLTWKGNRLIDVYFHCWWFSRMMRRHQDPRIVQKLLEVMGLTYTNIRPSNPRESGISPLERNALVDTGAIAP
uniref:Uncharacterized protein n=1 Tax=Candidatus Kentrum sp. TC TaxID=2126339 RepID=A0A450YDW5_9GAMM|nr:MAG: hypothetical protein BECKTC1821E_GA0114239_100512 [Candidatus Kentron sp. TC]